MIPRLRNLALITVPVLILSPGMAFAGRGGGFRGGGMGGMRAGGMGGMGGMRPGGMGGMGGMRPGGMGSFNRMPSFGNAHAYGGYGGMRGAGGMNAYGARGVGGVAGPYGGRAGAGYRGGSATGPRGTDIRYGAAGAGAVGPRGGAAARGVAGVGVTTPGGRTFTDVDRAGAVVGPGGGAAVRTSSYRGWHNPGYAGYHSGWVHGYWPGHYGGWGWGGGWGLGGYGYGLATGVAAWGLGSSLYSGWGYMPYTNPYYAAPTVAVQPPVYDYAQPIDTVDTPPDAGVTDPALMAFDQARAAFQAGDYNQALAMSDQALKAMPDDAAIHEFRALTLFALGRYDEAAAGLYAVLSTGPGWDWTTLIGLYPSVDVYTAQLRALEQSIRTSPEDAAPRFVLAFLYMTAGQNTEAADQLKAVTTLEPKDRLSAQLLQSITRAQQPPQGEAPDPADNPPAAPSPAPAAATARKLAGNWTASPAEGTTITLKIAEDGQFTWTVTAGGKSHALAGQSSFADGVLTLAQAENAGPPLVGEVTWQDDGRFNFQALGGGKADPGLTFRPGS